MSRRTLLGSSGYHPMLKEAIDYYFLHGFSWTNFPTTNWLDNLNQFYNELQAGGLINAAGLTQPLKQGIFEYLHLWTIEAASVDFGRLNLVRPSWTPLTGTPSFLSKTGIGNAGAPLVANFRLAVVSPAGPGDTVLPGTDSSNSCNAVWVKVGGAEATYSELMRTLGETNGRLYTIRQRVNPRIDMLHSYTSASPAVVQNGTIANNTIYGAKSSANVCVSFVNSTETVQGSSALTSDNLTIQFANNMLAGRYVGGAWFGNGSWNNAHLVSMRTAITNFNSRL